MEWRRPERVPVRCSPVRESWELIGCCALHAVCLQQVHFTFGRIRAAFENWLYARVRWSTPTSFDAPALHSRFTPRTYEKLLCSSFFVVSYRAVLRHIERYHKSHSEKQQMLKILYLICFVGFFNLEQIAQDNDAVDAPKYSLKGWRLMFLTQNIVLRQIAWNVMMRELGSGLRGTLHFNSINLIILVYIVSEVLSPCSDILVHLRYICVKSY